MKKALSQIVKFSLFCALIGCQKDVRPDWFAQGWGSVNVLYNSSEWSNAGATALLIKGQLNTTCNGYLDIQFFRFSRDGFAQELLQLSGVPTQTKGRYALVDGRSSKCGNGSALASYTTSDDDVGKSTYSLDMLPSNYLEITEYDLTNRRVSGRFGMTFTKIATYQNDDPAVVRFENGRFSTLIAVKGRFE